MADAITRGTDNRLYFAEPLVEQMTMPAFLSKISSGSVQTTDASTFLR
jgi:jumonji domain-containing protein 7